MRRILCFGDSNTHGYIPGGGRYDESIRWPRVLGDILGEDYDVIEEGLNGRTSSFLDPTDPYGDSLTGMHYIIPCLLTHEPLDLTVLMLGSNDMKAYLDPSVEKIADSLEHMVKTILDVSGTPVLLVSPIFLGDDMPTSEFASSFPHSSIEISRQLGGALRQVAERLDVYFLDAAKIAIPSPADSLHLGADGHARLAEAIARTITTEVF